jgi:vancomycin resistance protein YoaR
MAMRRLTVRRAAGRTTLGAAAGGFLVVSVVTGSLALAAIARGYRSDKIARGVTLGDIAVGGMTEAEALEALDTQVRPKLSGPVSLTHGKDSWILTRTQLGVILDLEASVADAMRVGHTGGKLQAWRERRRAARDGLPSPLHVTVDDERLGVALEGLREQVEREPKPAQVEFDRATQRVSVTPDVPGRKLDLNATREALLTALESLATSAVELVVTEARAGVTTEDLSSIDCVLGSYTTNYNAGEAPRAHNIALAAASLNGNLVRPGERLSYNETVGERTKDRGFQMAHVYEEGEVRDGIGGGVCQVSTTLYNAALLSGLKIARRSPHMMPVAYIPTGRDATVDWTSGLDLIIENSAAQPIYLVSFAGGGSITCIFLGASSDKPESVEIIRSGSAEFGFETTEKTDNTKPVGSREVKQKGRKGYKVTVHRVIRWPGKDPTKEFLSSDTYPKRDEIIILGAASPESEASTQLPAPKASTKASAAKGAPGKSGAPAPTPEEPAAEMATGGDEAAAN